MLKKKVKTIIAHIFIRAERYAESCKLEATRPMLNNESQGQITPNVVIHNRHNFYIGKNSYINGGLFVASPNAKIVIGDDCSISYAVHFRTDMKNYIKKDTIINKQGCYEADIIIGNDVWIGYGAQVLAGVTVGDGVVIAAGAVVVRDCEPYSLYAGVPAKKIKERI